MTWGRLSLPHLTRDVCEANSVSNLRKIRKILQLFSSFAVIFPFPCSIIVRTTNYINKKSNLKLFWQRSLNATFLLAFYGESDGNQPQIPYPPRVCIACILALSLSFFTGCMTEADSGSDDDNGQVTTPVENPDGGNTSNPGTSGGSNTNPSNPETPKATCTITFDANGGTGSIASITEVAGTEITLPENAFTKDGWIFAGWNTKDDGTGTNYEDKAKITLIGNITLYAKWAVTAANVSEVIKNIPADGKVHTVALVGEISEDTITAIRSALYENSGARISLDMSGTTGLTKIPDNAFYDADKNAECKALAGIVLPEGIESINGGAFQMCANLTDIVIPDSIKTIGNFAFYSVSFASIKFGSRLESIGEYAFDWCNSLTEITVPGNVKTIGYMTFDCCSNLEKVVIEEGVQIIGRFAFSGCEKLASVTIPKSVTSIGDYAFSYCDALQTVNYGGTVAEWNALKDNGKIISTGNNDLLNAAIYCIDGIVTTADKAAAAIASLESGEYKIAVTGELTDVSAIRTALKNNENAKVSLDLSQTTGLTSIGYAAFAYCSSLVSVNIPNGVTSIARCAFRKCSNLTAIVIPDSVDSIGERVFEGCSSLTELTVSEDNQKYESYENCIYTKAEKTFIAPATGLTSIKFLDGVTSIGDAAFYACKNLTSITIPNSVTSIGGYAFKSCSNLTSVTIPDSVTSIGTVVFMESSLTSITIPDSITSIDKDVFYLCNITTVTYGGTKAQWATFGVSSGSITIHCSDGDI